MFYYIAFGALFLLIAIYVISKRVNGTTVRSDMREVAATAVTRSVDGAGRKRVSWKTQAQYAWWASTAVLVIVYFVNPQHLAERPTINVWFVFAISTALLVIIKLKEVLDERKQK